MTGQLYRAYLEYLDQENKVRSTSIQFLAADPQQAAIDVFRWFCNRFEAFNGMEPPNPFFELLAFKLFVIEPQRLDEHGYLRSDLVGFGAEWKCDAHFWPKEVKRPDGMPGSLLEKMYER